MKSLIIFDLDGTLAESKSPLDQEMGALLGRLLSVARAAIISGGSWAQFEMQVLPNLPQDEMLKKLSLLPTCGTKFYRYDGTWKKLYSEDFSDEEKRKITEALNGALNSSGFKVEKHWGELIEDRGSRRVPPPTLQMSQIVAKRRSHDRGLTGPYVTQQT